MAGFWGALSPAGRLGLAGVVVSAALAVALGFFISMETREQLLASESRGLQAAVDAVVPSLPDLGDGSLSPTEIELMDRLVDRAILDSDHVRVKIWSPTGRVIYSDAHSIIGRTFQDVTETIEELSADGSVIYEVTDLDKPENETERQYERLIEYYVPVRAPDGRITAVFEIYEDVVLLEAALGRVTAAIWLAIGSGLSILLIFLVALVRSSVRSIARDRQAAEARAGELAVLVGAADALAGSLEPREFFGRLESEIRSALGLARLSIEPTAPEGSDLFRHQLRDGSWLVAEGGSGTLSANDRRVLRSVGHSLDAALANATLYAEVRDAARTRKRLLRQVVDAHEEERGRLVGDLHDSLAADLIRILYGVRGIVERGAGTPDDIRAELIALEKLTVEAESELRAFMNRVRPLAIDEMGLSAALRSAGTRFAQETRCEIALDIRGDPALHSPEAQLVILRAGEEALMNVRKHGRASRVRLTLRSDAQRLRLAVDDDGAGWPQDADAPEEGRGLGLAYLRERVAGFGGAIRRERSRLGGARLVVEIPGGSP